MLKYDLVYEQLLYEGTLREANFFEPAPATRETLLLTHTEVWLDKLEQGNLARHEERKTGFPYSPALVHREKVIMQGTVDAAWHALQHGCGANIAGGTHHAYAGSGEGFCLLNDMAVAANVLLHENRVRQILIVDLDVHQGNGTAKIFENEPRVFTFSMHGKDNFPLHKEKSDLDVELPDGSDDTTYLPLLDRHLKTVLDRIQPDFVFYLCGVDVLATDKLGRLGMTLAGCRERDKTVFTECKNAGLPVAIALGGGYSPNIRHIVDAHANTFRLMADLFF